MQCTILFAAVSVVFFFITCISTRRLTARVERSGIDVPAITTSRRWAVYVFCGAMVMVVWATMMVAGGESGEFAGSSFLVFVFDAFSLTFSLRAAFDLWPVCRDLSDADGLEV